MSDDQNSATLSPAASVEAGSQPHRTEADQAEDGTSRKMTTARGRGKILPKAKSSASREDGSPKRKPASRSTPKTAALPHKARGENSGEAAGADSAQPVPKSRKRSSPARGKKGAAPEPPAESAGEPFAEAVSASAGRQDFQTPSHPAPAETQQPDGGQSETPEGKSRYGMKSRGRRKKQSAPSVQPSEALAADIKTPLERARELAAVLALPPGRTTPSQENDPGAKKRTVRKKETAKATPPPAAKRMFISVIPGEQVEVALTENGIVLEYYLDMLHQRKLKGNIYKGVIHNIDSNLQAAFVNYGSGKNGFLQIDQVHPEYWQTTPDPARDKKFPPIQKALKTGQEILVQVVKEPAGSKGAFLTTWLSLAGRFLVLTPGQEQIGVSRKVTDPEERKRLREMMNGIDPGAGFGVIVRTVGEGATKTTLKTDLQYLKRLWREIRKKGQELTAPALIYQEPGLSERSVRDYLTEDVGEIWVDSEDEAQTVRAMVSLLFPRKKELVHPYSDMRISLWEKFGLLNQLDQIYAREVALPSGGRLVFDQTEALMAIDINSGKISGKNNFEAMAFKTNMEAAEAIAKQLRLRDIGGQIVIDFIEMRDKKHVLEVEKTLRQAMKGDRARHDVARMSSFGLLELVRQRMGSSAISICMETCASCGGTGLRRNMEWQALQALRTLRQKMRDCGESKYVFTTVRELGMYLLNNKRDALHKLEQDFGKILEIHIDI